MKYFGIEGMLTLFGKISCPTRCLAHVCYKLRSFDREEVLTDRKDIILMISNPEYLSFR